jgi:4-hydroxy-tetrahydrodipicolinate reductase
VATAGPINVELADKFPKAGDVAVDFSQPEAADRTVDYCLENSVALVSGTTGLSDQQREKIKAASEKIPIIYGTNMSVGMNVLFSLVGKVATMLGDECDIENICKATGRDCPGSLTHGRSGKDALRQKGTIGVHAIRAGDITGVHSVIFGTLGETVTLNHTANSRDTFARGALRAAKWLVGKEPALYSMADVLGIS